MSYWIEVEPTGRVRSITQALGETAPMPLVSGNTLHLVEQQVDPKRAAWFDDELADIGEAPSPAHVYDWATRAWTDPRTLAFFKEEHWETIKAQRDAIEFGTFVYNGHVFDGDVDAQRRLNVLISVSKSALAVGATFSVTFVLADNSTVELTPTDFVAIEQVKVMQVMTAFETAIALRALIEAATTVAEVQAVAWPT